MEQLKEQLFHTVETIEHWWKHTELRTKVLAIYGIMSIVLTMFVGHIYANFVMVLSDVDGHILTRTALLILPIYVCIIGISILILNTILDKLWKNVRYIRETTNKISRGRFEPFVVDGNGELLMIAKSFNRLAFTVKLVDMAKYDLNMTVKHTPFTDSVMDLLREYYTLPEFMFMMIFDENECTEDGEIIFDYDDMVKSLYSMYDICRVVMPDELYIEFTEKFEKLMNEEEKRKHDIHRQNVIKNGREIINKMKDIGDDDE